MNNYAISSDGIATALQDSASALMEGGNNLEQATALVAAANRVVQDPSSVGSALRTISLRLRGTSVEILEEMGEETDGVVESFSKMQEKIKALSGVDIVDMNGAYKDTYTILKEIGTVWETMSDMDQAALLELMAGKNRANTLSAILSNMKDLEGAYESALNAEGSALKENEAYLDSIQGRIDKFTNSLQTFWMNLLDTSLIKGFVDVGTDLIEFLDSGVGHVSMLGAALAGLGKWLKMPTAFTIMNEQMQIFGKSVDSIKNNFTQLSNESNKFVAGFKAIFAGSSSGIDPSKMISQDAFDSKLNQAIDLFKQQGSAVDQVEWDKYVDGVSRSDAAMGKALKTCKIQNGEIIKGTGAYQTYTGAATGAAVGTKTVGTAAGVTTGKLIALKVGALAANVALSLLGGLAITGIISLVSWIANAGERTRELSQEAANASKQIREQNDSLADYKAEITSLRTELDSNNLSEAEAYDARERLLQIQNELIDKYGQEAKGINLVTGELEAQKAVIDSFAKKDAQQWVNNNQKSINDAIDFFESDTKGGQLDSGWELGKTAITNWGFSKNVKDMIDEYVNGRDHIDTSTTNIGQGIYFDGSVEEVKSEVEEFQNWLGDKESELQSKLNDLTSLPIDEQTDDVKNRIKTLKSDIEQLQDVREDLGKEYANWFGDDSTYAANKAVMDEAKYQTAMAKYTDQYIDILDAQNKLTEAQAKGDPEAIKSAIDAQQAAIEKAMKDSDESWMDEYWNSFADSLAEQEFEINVELNEDGLQDELNKIVQTSGLSTLDNNQILDMVDRGINVEGATDASGQYTAEQISGLVALQAEADKAGIEITDLISILTNFGIISGRVSEDVVKPVDALVQTYSTIKTSVETFNDILSQTSEITVDNTKVTEDYKDSLIALVGSEAEVNKYFDKTNKLIVKDAKGLNTLVQATKKNVAANASLAKSQARLQYYQLFKKMQACVGAKGVMFNATKSEVLALYQEMNALEKTIAQYSRLEAQLLDTGNAYDQFDKAQEIDSATDYVGSIETWISALGEAFNTAELGTESAQVAIKGLVPESVYKDLDTVDEKMAAIYSYFKTGKLAQYVDIQFDEDGAIESAEMKLGNLRKFIEDGLSNGTLTGSDWMHFDLSEDIDSLEEFADAMGVTKEVAFAFIESMEDHDIEWLNGDYSSIFEDILPDNLANDIYDNTSALADLAAQLANGEITAEEYTAQWSELNKVSQENAQKARENATVWIETSNDIEAAKTRVQELSDELQILKQQGASEAEIQVKTNELNAAEQDLTNLVAKLSELETMDPVVLQVALDQAQAEIEEFETANSTLLTKVELVQDKESGEYDYNVKAGITLDENEKKKLEGYLEDINAKYSFETALGKDIPTTEDHLKSIEQILQSIHDVLSGKEKPNTTSADGSVDIGDVASDGLVQKIQELFTTTIPEKWDEFWAGVGTFLDGLGEEANVLKEKLVSFFKDTVMSFVTETIPNAFANAFEIVANFFTETIPDAMEDVKASVSEFFATTLPEAWNSFWTGLSDGVLDLIDSATNGLDKFSKALDNFLDNTLPEAWNNFWNSVGDFVFETIPYTIGYIEGASERFWQETVPQAWDTFVENAKTGWNDLVESAKTFVSNTIDSIKNSINNTVESAKQVIEDLIQSIDTFVYETWPSIRDSALEHWANLKKYIIDAFADVVNGVETFLNVTLPQVGEDIKRYFGNLFETARTEFLTMFNSISAFINVTIPGKINEMSIIVGDFLSGVVSSVGSFMSNVLTWIPNKIAEIWDNFTAGFSAGRSGGGFTPASGAQRVNGTAHAHGTAHQSGDWGLPKSEHNSLVGELGPEMVVDPSSGRYYTVGDTGAEMVDLPKGAIIFNHEQTKSLLNNGYVTSRGKAYADGNAHVTIWPNASSKPQWEGTGYDSWYDPTWDASDAFSNAADSMSDAADSMSDAADDSEQVVDFIEMKLEEIEAIIEKTSARISNFLDDTTSIKSKDELYDELVKAEKDKSEAYLKAAQKYNVEAATALSGVPQQYQKMARNGAIAIKDFIGEDQVEIAEKIQEYRDWAAKADEAENGHLEAIAAISAHRVEQLEDIATDFENIVSISKSHSDLLQAEMDFIEESGNRLSEDYYEELKKHSQKQLDDMQAERAALQKILDDSVAAGDVVIGSDDWYSMLETIYEVDQEIIDCKTSLEEFQNAINDLYWDNFDKLIEQLDAVDSELSNLYDLISDDDKIVDDMGNWTADGYTALGLLVQQMEVAQQKSKEYGDAISKLKRDYADGLYSTDEYNEKLAELTDSQYSAIKSYEDAKDAIVDLNKTRVDAVKEGIQKEIDAYEELINKKKESLDADKDARDFERSVEESNKSISDVERKIASLKGNTSSSAMAERRRLEEELRKLQQEREDLFYDESVENQQDALDKELENFQDAKNKEIEDLEEYLKNQEKVLQDSFAIVQENTQQIAGKLVEIAEDYGVTISDTVATPWINGTNAIGKYQEQLNTSVSATTKNLETLKQQLKDLETQADKTANSVINATKSSIVTANDGHQTSIKGYAKGTTSVPKSGFYNLDELGPELVLHAGKNGKLEYLTMDSAVVPADLTQKLMQWGQLDPSQILENNRPVIGTPGITTTNNTITIDASVGTLLNVEHLDGSNPAEVAKLVDKAWEKKMQTLNNSIKKFTR